MNEASRVQPRRPQHLSDYAEECLQALASLGLGDRISIGGALGLLHYLDYRPTLDVDAWWVMSATPQDRARVIEAIEDALQPLGQVRKRAWGHVVSIELLHEGRTAFSFQIAQRTAQLEPSVPGLWPGVLLDSFPDLVASKMVALVERGAPRDFRDIYSVCQAGLTTPSQCWTWWKDRQRLAGSDVDASRARLAVETHLSRIEKHRPLEHISDPEQQATSDSLRTWFKTEFLDALVD